MKWREMTLLQKILFVVGCVCFAGSAVLYVPLLWDVELLPLSCANALMGVVFLCLGLITNNKKYAKGQFIFAAVQFLFALLHLFLIELR